MVNNGAVRAWVNFCKFSSYYEIVRNVVQITEPVFNDDKISVETQGHIVHSV